MKKKRKLAIIHIDGLSYNRLLKALKNGDMPNLQRLIEKDDYAVLPYSTGLPSTTPFAQAGILYGDNDNIPSFTWFDKQSGLPVRFGTMASFKHVAHKYFKNTLPLTYKGATIAACYPAGASETFALAYNDPKSKTNTHHNARHGVLYLWFRNPLHILDWIRFTLLVFLRYFIKFLHTRMNGQNVAIKYFLADLLQEIFLHHMTRYAVVQAIRQHYNPIYAAFYAYDDGAHAFGPDDSFCRSMLHQLDNSIGYIITNRSIRGNQYELLFLSDHGQISTIPFIQYRKKQLAQIIADWYPTYDIWEIPGKHITPKKDMQDGEIILTYSGGIGHLYLRSLQGKSHQKEIEKKLSGIVQRLVSLPEIGCVLVKKEKKDILVTKKHLFHLTKTLSPQLRKYLQQFDDPELLFKQLVRLNSFHSSGDIIFFGAFIRGKQINFENQYGGHGAFGGEQMHPFLIIKKKWKQPKQPIQGAEKVHYVIKDILES